MDWNEFYQFATAWLISSTGSNSHETSFLDLCAADTSGNRAIFACRTKLAALQEPELLAELTRLWPAEVPLAGLVNRSSRKIDMYLNVPGTPELKGIGKRSTYNLLRLITCTALCTVSNYRQRSGQPWSSTLSEIGQIDWFDRLLQCYGAEDLTANLRRSGEHEELVVWLKRVNKTTPLLFASWTLIELLLGEENRRENAPKALPGYTPSFEQKIIGVAATRDGESFKQHLQFELYEDENLPGGIFCHPRQLLMGWDNAFQEALDRSWKPYSATQKTVFWRLVRPDGGPLYLADGGSLGGGLATGLKLLTDKDPLVIPFAISASVDTTGLSLEAVNLEGKLNAFKRGGDPDDPESACLIVANSQETKGLSIPENVQLIGLQTVDQIIRLAHLDVAPDSESQVMNTYIPLKYLDSYHDVSIGFEARLMEEATEEPQTKSLDQISMENVIQNIQRSQTCTFLIGPPGRGKTALLRYLTHTLNVKRVPSRRPAIYLDLERTATASGSKEGESRLAYRLQTRYSNVAGITTNIPMWQDWLKCGNFTLCLDGSTKSLDNAFRELEAEYPLCPVVAGVKEESVRTLARGIKHRHLSSLLIPGFSDEMFEEYIGKQGFDEERKKRIRSLYTNPIVAHYGPSPLFISALCEITDDQNAPVGDWQDSLDKPGSVTDVFWKSVKKQVMRGGQITDNLEIDTALRSLGYIIFKDQNNATQIDQDKLYRIIEYTTKELKISIDDSYDLSGRLFNSSLLTGVPGSDAKQLNIPGTLPTLLVGHYLANRGTELTLEDLRRKGPSSPVDPYLTMFVLGRWKPYCRYDQNIHNKISKLIDMLLDTKQDDLFRHNLAIAVYCLPEITDRELVDRITQSIVTVWLQHQQQNTLECISAVRAMLPIALRARTGMGFKRLLHLLDSTKPTEIESGLRLLEDLKLATDLKDNREIEQYFKDKFLKHLLQENRHANDPNISYLALRVAKQVDLRSSNLPDAWRNQFVDALKKVVNKKNTELLRKNAMEALGKIFPQLHGQRSQDLAYFLWQHVCETEHEDSVWIAAADALNQNFNSAWAKEIKEPSFLRRILNDKEEDEGKALRAGKLLEQYYKWPKSYQLRVEQETEEWIIDALALLERHDSEKQLSAVELNAIYQALEQWLQIVKAFPISDGVKISTKLMEKVFLAAEYILEQRIKQPVLLPDLAITIIHSRISLMPDTKLKKELLPRLCEMACNRAALSKTRLQAIQILANSDQQLSEQDQEELLKLARNPQQIADAHDWTRLQLELIGTCMKQIDRAKIPSDLLQYLVEKTTANALYARRASASILLNIIRDGKSIQRISSGTYKLVATSSWWKNQARLNE